MVRKALTGLLILAMCGAVRPVLADSANPSPIPAHTAVAPHASPSKAPAKDALERKLQPGDELEITIACFPDQHNMVKVRDDGNVYVALAGDIRAAGLTLPEFKKQLEKLLGKTLRYPQTLVGLKSMAVGRAVVVGDVPHPGEFPVTPAMHITELMALAGVPLSDTSSAEAVLYRNNKSQPVALRLPEANDITVNGGDVVYIKLAHCKVSVLGSVVTPGVHELPDAQPTLWQALMAAGGPKPEAAMKRVNVYHGSTRTSKFLDVAAGPSAPDANLRLDNGDLVTVSDQRVLVIGTASSKGAVSITGHESLIEVLAEVGATDKSQLKKVVIVHAGPGFREVLSRADPAQLAKVGKDGQNPSAEPSASAAPGMSPSDAPSLSQVKLATEAANKRDGKKSKNEKNDKDQSGKEKDGEAVLGGEGATTGLKIETLNLAKTMKKGDPRALVPLEDGDIIVVNPPAPPSFFSGSTFFNYLLSTLLFRI